MLGRVVSTVSFLLLACVGLRANPASGDTRLEALFQRFMAPCCWRENLLNHQSPKAVELRAEIARLTAAGQSDEQIKTSLVAQYSTRILSMPEGTTGRWLSWTPVAVGFAGLGFVIAAIRRALGARPSIKLQAAALPDLPDTEW